MEAQVYEAPAAEWERSRLDYPAADLFAALERREDRADGTLCAELEDTARRPDCILLSLPDRGRNLDLARRLVRQMNRLGLSETERPKLLVFSGSDGSVCLLEGQPQVRLISEMEGLLSYDAVILRTDDRGAEALHENYRAQNPGAKSWYELDTFTQSSNRAALRDEENKRLLTRDPETDREATYWALAQYEHRRWEAFYAAHGWVRLPREELTRAEWDACTTKRAEEKRHACLCPWDELDALPQREPGLLKRYDYENVCAAFSRTE